MHFADRVFVHYRVLVLEQGFADFRWKDLSAELHLHVILNSLTTWNRLIVENPVFHKTAVCRSFLYLAHTTSLSDEQVLDLIPDHEYVYIYAANFTEVMKTEVGGKQVNTRLVKMFCKMNMLV